MMYVALLLVMVAVVTAYPVPYRGFPYGGYYGHYPYNYGYYGFPYYNHHNGYGQGGKLAYYGEFAGSCLDKPDGLYYVDDHSFAYCFSGQKSVQPCAEGSANPPLAFFSHQGQYSFYDFCSVNLVAQGYGSAPVPGYGSAPVYPEPRNENSGYKVEVEYGYKDNGYPDAQNEHKKEAY